MVKFKAKITIKDLYLFNIRHIYTGTQGILSIVVAAICIGMCVYNWNSMDVPYRALYIIMGLFMLVYIPGSLYMRVKAQMGVGKPLSDSLDYELCDEGVKVSSAVVNDSATLPWDMIYKIVTRGENLFIYSARNSAYIIPKSEIGDNYEPAKKVFEQKLPDFKLELKW